MTRILLADDSPHAQRMGERILREEGYEVVSVADGDAAIARLDDFTPDVILADAFLPRRSGFDLCREVKANPRFRNVRVVLTAGVLEPVDEDEATLAGSDAVLKKPFEASVVIDTIRPLLETPELEVIPVPALSSALPEIDKERVRAAVTIALDAALPAMVDEITERVMIALNRSI